MVSDSTAPKISTKSFINPGTPPIPEMPSIRGVMGGTRVAPPPSEATEPQASPAIVPPPANEPTEPETPMENPDPTAEPAAVETPAAETPAEPEDFATCWNQLFTELFSNNFLIYYNLKDETPEYQDDTIRITVKNDIQREEFDSRRKSILEYWRNHFKLNVDDLEIIVNEQKAEKKVIINSEDKLNNMMEQNQQLKDFLNILQFRIKD
jgi:hypothetical protein